jgi:Tfp pilus assembly protein PilN
MIRINLLGQPRPKKARAGGAPMAGALQMVFVVVALVLGFGALFVHYYQMRSDLTKIRSQIDAQKMERNRLQNIKLEVDRRQQEKAALKERIDVIEQLQRNRSGGQELLDALAHTVDRVDQLWMIGLKRSGNSLQLDGQADTLNAVASFISELKRSGYFDKVEITETRQDDQHQETTIFLFTLTADFTLPSQGTGAQQPPAKTTRN